MGVFNFFKRQNKSDSFDSFPDLTNYRIYLFLKGGELNEVIAQMGEYYEMYPTETAFSAQLYKLNDTPWTYIVLTLLPNVTEISPIWDYFNILLWMSDKAELSFAYAYSTQFGELPLFAYRDYDNQFGDSCKGIANGKQIYAKVPEQEVLWGQSVSEQFDYEGYLWENYGVDISLVL